MKILWVSNSPEAPSGYGSQTRQVGRRLAADGHEVVFAANDGARGDRLWEGMPVLGSGEMRYSLDTIREDVLRVAPDRVIVLYDVWVFTEGSRASDPLAGIPGVAAWVPVDHWPVPPTLMPWLTAGGRTAVAMSRFGEGQLLAASARDREEGGAGFPVLYAPHAVDRSVFRPGAEMPGGGDPFRRLAGIPDDVYLVGIVATNIGTGVYDRKGFGDMLQALAPFLGRHPEAHVYIHAGQSGDNGISLPHLLGILGLPADRVHFPDQHLIRKRAVPDEAMAAIYGSLDVLLGTSRGEGFGVPHVEAQACGTPVILSNFTASTELVAPRAFDPSDRGFERHPSGWLVPVETDYDPRHGSFFGKPVLGAILRALEEHRAAWADPATRAAMRDAATANSARWDADRVYADHWRPVLDALARGTAAPNRAERRRARREEAA